MFFLSSFFIASSGLFDFDGTFFAESGLFFILALTTSFWFLAPISEQIKGREKYISANFNKSALFLFFCDQNLHQLNYLALEESNEAFRKFSLLQGKAQRNFEKEILLAQKENFSFLAKTEKSLLVKSVSLFLNFKERINNLANEFFLKKFI